MRPTADITTTGRIHAAYIGRLDGIVDLADAKLSAIARRADLAIEKQLDAFLDVLDSVPAGATPRMVPKVRQAERALYENVQGIVDSVFGSGSAFEAEVTSRMAEAAKLGNAKATSEHLAMKAGASVIRKSDGVLRLASLAMSDAYDMVSRNLTLDAVQAVRKLVSEEILQGNGTVALKTKLIKSGLIKDLDLGKRVLKSETRAQMIARTEVRRMSELMYSQTHAEVQPDPQRRLYKWISILSPTSGQDSLIRHGIVMSEQEWQTTDFGDGMYGLPPIRPNDNCSKIFYDRDWLTPENQAVLDEEPGSEARRQTSESDEAERRKLMESPSRAA